MTHSTRDHMRLLCLECRGVVDWSEGDAPLSRCPYCGTSGLPGDLDDMVNITITKHELRVLTMWAANWAAAIKDSPDGERAPMVVQGICDGLATYTDIPLSMRQELADLRERFGDVTLIQNGEEIDPP